MSKIVDIKGTMDLNGQSVSAGSNYDINVGTNGALTNNAAGGAALTIAGDDTRLNVEGKLENTSESKMVINCNGGGSSAGTAGIFLKDGTSMVNGSDTAGGFEFNINGTDACLSIDCDLDMNNASATVNIDTNSSGTVLSVESGGTLSVGALNLN